MSLRKTSSCLPTVFIVRSGLDSKAPPPVVPIRSKEASGEMSLNYRTGSGSDLADSQHSTTERHQWGPDEPVLKLWEYDL